jgi:lipoyl(octanoyl) transferase
VQKVYPQDLGLVDYKQAWELQEKYSAESVQIKINNRKNSGALQKETTSRFIFCEHPNVFTLGKSGSFDNLLVDEEGLKTIDATFYKINRGGDITYHGPGQIVGYPILDLDNFFTDIHKYLRFLEEMVIRTLSEFGIESGRHEGYTGVWIDAGQPLKARKICAMGVRCSRWITMHGFALNANPDLSYFKNIVPCGIDDKQVTSMEKELGRKVDVNEVKQKLKTHFCELFQAELIDA